MLGLLIVMPIVFYWLLRETDYLRVRLMVGDSVAPKYARYAAYQILGARKPGGSGAYHRGDNYPPDFSPNGEPEYKIVLSPGIDNVLCGWLWLDKHCADHVDYTPTVQMDAHGVKYSMTIKSPAIIPDIVKANKVTKPYMIPLIKGLASKPTRRNKAAMVGA